MRQRIIASLIIVLSVLVTMYSVYQNHMADNYGPELRLSMWQLTALAANWLAPIFATFACLCWVMIQSDRELDQRNESIKTTVRV